MDSIDEFQDDYKQRKIQMIFKFATHNPIDFLEEFLYKEPKGHVARKVAKRILKEQALLEKQVLSKAQ